MFAVLLQQNSLSELEAYHLTVSQRNVSVSISTFLINIFQNSQQPSRELETVSIKLLEA